MCVCHESNDDDGEADDDDDDGDDDDDESDSVCVVTLPVSGSSRHGGRVVPQQSISLPLTRPFLIFII